MPGKLFLPGGVAQHRELPACPALFHLPWQGVHIQGAQLQQPLAGKGQGLRGHVVQVAHQLADLPPTLLLGLAPEGPQTVGGGKLPGAQADAHLVHGHRGHGAKPGGELGEQGCPSGGAQLPLDGTAVDGHPRE